MLECIQLFEILHVIVGAWTEAKNVWAVGLYDNRPLTTDNARR